MLTHHLGNANQNHNEVITPNLSEWLSSKSLQITSVDKDMVKGEPYALLMGMQIGVATMEKSMEIPQQIKNRTVI